jgi:hypothetical protein
MTHMNQKPQLPEITRRIFLGQASMAVGGLALGVSLTDEAQAAEQVAEVSAWVLIHPNDKVRRKSGPPTRMGQLFNGRQPRYPRFPPIRSPGGRCRKTHVGEGRC